MRKRCVGSIPTLSAKLVSRIEKPGLSRLAHNQKVTGSNPVSATKLQVDRRTIENLLKGSAYVNAGGPISKFKRGRKKKKTDSGEIG